MTEKFLFDDCWFDFSFMEKNFVPCCYECIYHIIGYGKISLKEFTNKILNDACLHTTTDQFFEENDFDELEEFERVMP